MAAPRCDCRDDEGCPCNAAAVGFFPAQRFRGDDTNACAAHAAEAARLGGLTLTPFDTDDES